MAYACPRCQRPVQRKSNALAQSLGGLVGAMMAAAFGSFECRNCGILKSREFPPEVRSKMRTASAGMIVGALVIVVVVLAVLAYVKSR